MTLSHITLASLCLSAGMTFWFWFVAVCVLPDANTNFVGLVTIWFIASIAGLLAEIVRRGE